VNDERYLNFYDGVHYNLIERYKYNWSRRYSRWNDPSKTTYTYDENNNMIECITGDYNKGTFTYDENNNLIEEYWEDYWGSTKWLYSYDEYNNLAEKIHQGYERWTYLYNENGDMIEEYHYYYIHDQWDILNNWIYTYTYDNNDRVIEMIREVWDNSTWQNTGKWMYTLDEFDNLTEEIYQTWVDSEWQNIEKWTYAFDENKNLIEELYQEWVDSDWQDVRKGTFEYITVTGLEPQSSAVTSYFLSHNYPNPFNPSTTIEFDLPKSTYVRIEIYNAAGQKVQTLLNEKMSAGSHQVEFNAQNLSSGVYFYRIEAGEFVDVKKMILLR
jgi:hypothetical protein